jgi:ABC-type branched-subunit amino acid transport system substrate-binding protein
VSGPEPGLFTGAVNGLDAWAADVNASGGIDGRKVVIDHKDSALDCNTYTNDIKSLSTSVFALVGTFSVEDNCGEATLKANPNLLDLEASLLSPALFPYPNVYAAIPQPPGWATTEYQWVKDKYGTAAIEKTADLYSASSAANFKEEEAAAQSIGYKYVYTRGYGPTETNFTADILRMKADDVQVVDLVSDAIGVTSDFFKQAAQQDFHPLAVINTTAYDSTFFTLIGNPSIASNLVLSLRESMYLGEDAAAVPEITTMTNWLHTTHPGYPVNLFVVEAFSAGLLFQAAMAKAGPDPTQAGVIAAVKGTHSFNADGLITQTDPGAKLPPLCNIIAGVSNGKFVRIDPATTGFECKGTFHPYPAAS